ncbi:MAG: DoxX family protein [Pseudomonadota bacterium]
MTAASLEEPSKRYRLIQQALKGVLGFVFFAAGCAILFGLMDADFERLGYPEYISLILGVAYLLSVVCIYQTRYKFLQDWAYAGMAVSLVGASVSHVMANDPFTSAVPSLILQVVLVAAYAMRANLLSSAV